MIEPHQKDRRRFSAVRTAVRADLGPAPSTASRGDRAVHSSRGLRQGWQDHLNRVGPPGIDTNLRGGKGDAFRHYASYGLLADTVGETLADLIGMASEADASDDAVMDMHNNRQGIAAAERADDLTGFALEFMNDVAAGKIKIKDTEKGGLRDTTPADLHHQDGNRLEDRYRPDKQPVDPLDPQESYHA